MEKDDDGEVDGGNQDVSEINRGRSGENRSTATITWMNVSTTKILSFPGSMAKEQDGLGTYWFNPTFDCQDERNGRFEQKT